MKNLIPVVVIKALEETKKNTVCTEIGWYQLCGNYIPHGVRGGSD